MAQVIIAGGGIGGLTAALCLARRGVPVGLLEQTTVLSGTGAGIQLSPNCSRVLHSLGLEEALRQHGFLPEGTQFRHWRSGRIISESVLGASTRQRYGAPYYHIHRGDLVQILAEAVRRHPNIKLHTGVRLEGFTQEPRAVQVSTNVGDFTGSCLVGADGIHSVVREGLWGAVTPRFTGNIAWRALVETRRLPADLVRPMSTAWWGPGKHFVHYYVRGGEFVNCVCVVEKTGWELESWTATGEVAELQSDFVGWHDDIQQLIHHAEQETLFKWALFDRDPMPVWGQGRVTLLGDACHPTLPFMAQGAAMAIEDGAVLAGCVAAMGQGREALARYEDLRRSRTAGVQNGSRRNARVFHLSGINAWMRNLAVRAAGDRVMDGLFRYNALDAVGDNA